MIVTIIFTTSIIKVNAKQFESIRTGYNLSVYGPADEAGEPMVVKIAPDDPRYQEIYDRLGSRFPISAFEREDGKIAFCIEPTQMFANGDFEMEGWNYRSEWVDSPELFERMNLIAFHGFSKENKFADDWMYWYAVTYSTIYEEMLALTKNDIPDYQQSKQQILKEVDRHYLVPSFEKTTIQLLKDEPQTLIDANAVMHDMTITNDGGFEVSIVDQKLVVKRTETSPQKGTITLTKYANLTASDPVVYTHPSNQDVLVPATPKPISVQINVEQLQPDQVIIKKINQSNEPVAQAVFVVSLNAEFSDFIEVKTNDEGLSESLSFLNPGATVYIKEIYVPKPYVLSSEIKQVILSTGQTHEVVFTNQQAQGQIRISKVDDSQKPLAQAIFEVRDVNNQIVETLTTNEKGMALSSLLPLGKYFIEEKQAPNGYIKSNEVKEIDIQFDQKEIIEVHYTSSNLPITGTLHLHKYGEQLTGFKEEMIEGYTVLKPVFESKYLEGVNFKLEAANDIVRNKIKLYSAGDLVEQITTKNEVYTIEHLPLGTYKLIETSTLESFVLDPKVYTITLDSNHLNQVVVLESLELNNQHKKATIELEKVFEASAFLEFPGDLRDHTLFGLRTHEDIVLDDWTLMANQWVDIVKLDDDNRLNFEVLVQGNYQIVELTTHPLYQLLEEPIDIEVSFDETENRIITADPIQNNLKRGSLRLEKVDADDKQLKLKDVSFDLYRHDQQKQFVDTYTTNEDGIIEIVLEYGVYSLIETSTNPGYLKSNQAFEFEINDQTPKIEFVHENSQTTTLFSKMETTSKEYLEGAYLQVINQQGEIIDEWISTTLSHQIRGLSINESYVLKEVKAPIGYLLSEPIEFVVNNDPTQNIVMENQKIIVPVTLTKTDYDQPEITLSQVKFDLYEQSKDIRIGRYTTNDQGLIEVRLPFGDYYFIESEPLPGYISSSEPIYFSVTNAETVSLQSRNQKTKVKVVKIDGDSGIWLSGAKLQVIDKNQRVVEEWTSSQTAHVVAGLEIGETYTLKEISAPETYQISEPVSFVVSEAGSQDVVVKNYQFDIEVIIHKLDKESQKPLQYAYFEVYDKNLELLETVITSREGQAFFTVKPGEYFLKESQAPFGYLTDSNLIPVTVTGLEANQQLSLTLTNQALVLPKTGPLSLYLGLGFMGMTLVVVGYIFLMRRK